MCSEKGQLVLGPGSGSTFAIQGYVVRSVGVGEESPFQTQTLLTVLFPQQHCCFFNSRPRLAGSSMILDTCQSSASPGGTTGCTSLSSATSR